VRTPSGGWALDADLAAAFDRIDHQHLLRQLGTFPARGQIAGWLKAGVVEKGRFAPTEEGTPQGGVVSPLLLNVALHGMEYAAGVRYQTSGLQAGVMAPGSPTVVRYADDLVAVCHTRHEAEQVKARLAEWLARQGIDLQRGQDACCHPRGRFRLPGVHRPPTVRQVADQTEQGGTETGSGNGSAPRCVP